MQVFLALGSNLGDRREHLRAALARLTSAGIAVERVSPVVESPAMLPADAPAEWNRPFLNLVARCATEHEPLALLREIKCIEDELGRSDARRWSPRPIDVDILLYGERRIDTNGLTIPHSGLAARPFVLTPLAAIAPGIAIPELGKTALELATALDQRIPLWMGIINLTPDSFSDGGEHESWQSVSETIDRMLEAGVHILDFGAESTRPGSAALTADEEWGRLAPILMAVTEKLAADPLRPRISIDTYHAEVAALALGMGVDIINDVSGLTQASMLELAASSKAEFVAMHNLGLPADPAVTLPTTTSATDLVERWLDDQLETWRSAGMDLGRIIFDPGIGFGKNRLQSLELLRHIDRFANKGVRVLVGHSRKSFMNDFTGSSRHERDLVTIGASLALCDRGADIIRVHNVVDHACAYRGWVHVH